MIVCLLIAAVAQNGCRENTLINSKVAPSNNAVNVYSTSLNCITHTYNDDTTLTSVNIGGLPMYQALGAISDPFFGTINASTYFQIIPTTYSSTLYAGMTIDSAVLILPYSGFTYGDSANTTLTQTYQVFYVTAPNSVFNFDSNFYSYNTLTVDAGTPLSPPTIANLYSTNDTFSVLGVYYTQGVHIKLNLSAFLNRLNPAQNILTASSAPATDFVAQFNGLCVSVANPVQYVNALPYIRLDGVDQYSEANVTVYYHDVNNVAYTEPYFFSNAVCAHFNSITRNYASSPVNALFNSTAANDSIIALQNEPGASIDVVIPGISKLPQGVINKAELQLYLLPNYAYNSFLFPPEKVYPLGIANANYPAGIGAGVAYNIADRYPLTSLTPLTVLDGYEHTLNGRSVYTIDIPREVMASIAAKNDTLHLHISGTQDFYGTFHMVAAGGSYSDTTYRPKLFVVYSKLTK